MESQEQLQKSRVLKVESEESWEFFLSQAKEQSCPVVVHFTASWCAPSIAMKHFFEELALNFQDILFLLVDVDEVKVLISKTMLWALRKCRGSFINPREGYNGISCNSIMKKQERELKVLQGGWRWRGLTKMCYVGKASKIFIGIVAFLVIVGLILAFRWVRHEPNHKSHLHQCEGNSCSPPSFYPQPIPAAAAAAAAPTSFSPPTPPGPQAGSALSPLPP